MNDMFGYLIRKLDEEREHISETLMTGNIKDYAEYRQFCGVIRGLLIARTLIAETAERLESSDE